MKDQAGIPFVYAHFGAGAIIVVAIIAVTRLAIHAIYDGKRWRRFLFLVFLALAAAAIWWLLARGGVRVILHDFGRTGTATRPAGATKASEAGLRPGAVFPWQQNPVLATGAARQD